MLALRYPVLVEEFAIRHGSGGIGRQRGGDGVIRRIRFREPMQAAILSGRRAAAPFGLGGGDAGLRGASRIERADGTVEPLGRMRAERGAARRLPGHRDAGRRRVRFRAVRRARKRS